MRLFHGFFAGLVLAGILAIGPAAAFAHGEGGGRHFAGFAGRSFGGIALRNTEEGVSSTGIASSREIISGTIAISFLEVLLSDSSTVPKVFSLLVEQGEAGNGTGNQHIPLCF
jgi:hypothetical protein